MRVIKAMIKALLAMMVFIVIAELIAFVIKVSKVDPMVALGVTSLIGLFAMTTIWFYVTDNKE